MSLPSQFSITAENFTILKEAMEWYDAMPSGIADACGDRFHENMFDLQMNLLSDLLYDEDEYYLSHIELSGGKILVQFGLQNQPATDDEQYTAVEIVAESK